MSLTHLLGSLAILVGTVASNSAVAQEPAKVEVKQSTPEEACETFHLARANGDYESLFKVCDESYQLDALRIQIGFLARLGLAKSEKDPKYKEALEGLRQAYKSFGLRDLTEYIDKQYTPTPEDLKSFEAIPDKLACAKKMQSYLKHHKLYMELIAQYKTYKTEKKEMFGPYAGVTLLGKSQRNADVRVRFVLEQTPQGWIISQKAFQEAKKLAAVKGNPGKSVRQAPRETKLVELKLGTPEEAFETFRSALTGSDYVTAFDAVTKDSQLGMVRAAFFEVESASFSGSEAEFKSKRKSQGELFKSYGVEQGRVGNPNSLNKPAIMDDLKTCYVDIKNWSLANNSDANTFDGMKNHEIESQDIKDNTATIICKPIQHDKDTVEYPVYLLTKTGQVWQVDLEGSRKAGFDRLRDQKNLAAKSSTSGIRLKHVFSAAEKKPSRMYSTEISALSFSPDSRRLVVGAAGQPIQIWDLEKPERIHSIPLPKSEIPLRPEVAWSPDGRLLALALNAGDSSESFGLYSIQDKRYVSQLPKQKDGVSDAHWVGVDRLFFVAGSYGEHQILFGKIPPWKSLYNAVVKGSSVYGAAISPDGKYAAVTTGDVATLLDANGKVAANLPASEGNEIMEFAFSPTAKHLAIGRKDKLELYDIGEKSSIVLIAKTEGWVRSLSFTPDGAKLIVLTNKISILDSQTGKVLAEQKASGSMAALAPNGKFVATGADDMNGDVSIWELDIEVGPSLLPAVPVAAPDTITIPAPKPRLWTSADGNFKIEAEYVQKKQGFVQLKRKDTGQLISIQIEKLSEADQKIIESLP